MYQKIPVIIGQYRPLDSFLHRLDARSKIVPLFLIMVLSLLTQSMFFYAVILLLLILSLFYSKIELQTAIENFKPILVLVLINAIYHIIFSAPESRSLFDIFGFQIRVGALEAALFYSLRLIIFISTLFLLTLTSSPSALGEALVKIIKPLEKLKVPVSDFGLILFIALRFIPIMYDEFIAIKNAQTIRGVNFSGSIFNRIKKTSTILIPVFIAAINRADELSLAIQARGYRSNGKKTIYSRFSFGFREFFFMLLSTSFLLLIYYLIG